MGGWDTDYKGNQEEFNAIDDNDDEGSPVAAWLCEGSPEAVAA